MRLLSIGTFLFVLMFQFQNCAQDTKPNVAEDDSASATQLTCLDEDCIDAVSANLKIKANLFGGNILVKSGIDEFNVGGDCNEGGFANNVVSWELLLNNQVVRNSSQNLNAGAPLDTKCINGRFNLYVTLRAVSGVDNVDRVGLKTSSGAIQQHSLRIKIVGKTSDGKTDAGNTLDSVSTFSLVPST